MMACRVSQTGDDRLREGQLGAGSQMAKRTKTLRRTADRPKRGERAVVPETLAALESFEAVAEQSPWYFLWNRFKETHSEWWKRRDPRQPVYLLPEKVLDALTTTADPALRKKPRAPVLCKQEYDAELAFLKCCQKFGPDVVGVWNDQPISYALLGSEPNVAWVRNGPEAYEKAKAARRGEQPDTRKLAQARLAGIELADRYSEIAYQQLGYCGKLLLDGQYRKEIDVLRKQWTAARGPGVFPMSANEPGWPDVKDSAYLAFKKAAIAFLEKWGFASMATWDLPCPQGPVIGPAGVVHAVTRNQIVSAMPAYYDIRTNRTFHDSVVAEQAAVAKALGIKATYPLTDIGPRNNGSRLVPSEWATMFRLWFVEQAARSRSVMGRGLVERLEIGMERWLMAIGHPISVGRTKKLRGRYISRLGNTSSR